MGVFTVSWYFIFSQSHFLWGEERSGSPTRSPRKCVVHPYIPYHASRFATKPESYLEATWRSSSIYDFIYGSDSAVGSRRIADLRLHRRGPRPCSCYLDEHALYAYC